MGVLGGTFNPVTRAHLKLAETAQQQFNLGEVLFLLPEALPHRAPEEASLEERLALLDAAVAPYDRFSLGVCTHGLLLEMAQAVAPHYPANAKLYFLLGSDAGTRILRWEYGDTARTLKEMFARFDLVVASRGHRLEIPRDLRLEPYRAQIHSLTLPDDCQTISASGVRERVRKGQPLDDLVPAAVAEAIRRTGLYQR